MNIQAIIDRERLLKLGEVPRTLPKRDKRKVATRKIFRNCVFVDGSEIELILTVNVAAKKEHK